MTRSSSTPVPRPGAIDRATRAITLGAIRAPRQVLLAALALFAVSVFLASRLRVDGDFARLLPTESPTAKRFFGTLVRKGGASSTIAVVIESKDAVSNQRMADGVADRLRQLPPGVLRSVEVGPGAAREFFRDHRWVFASLPDLERAACELDLEVTRRDPSSLGLEESCDDAGGTDRASAKAGSAPEAGAPNDETPLARIRRKLTARMREVDRFPTGYFRTPAGDAFVVIARADAAGMGDLGSEAILSRVEAAVAGIPKGAFEKDTRVVFGGDIPTSIAERNALIEDMTLVSGVATLLILGSIVVFFRTPVVLLQIGSCVAVGCAFAFATAQVAYGHLNAATSFLASIIAGNGINAPIVYIARFRELRAQGLPVEDAAVEAAVSCRDGTLIAALAASGAYAALLSTSFRGFSEFGLIGASGMMACWAATFVVCPAALAVSDRAPAATSRRSSKSPRFSAFAARLAVRAPRWVLAAALLVTVVLCFPVRRYLRDPWEYNFARLRSRASAQTGASRASSVVDKVIGGRGSPILLLANDRSEAAGLAAEVLRLDRQPGRPPIVEKVETIDDRLGGSPADVSRKIELAGHVRETIDRLSKRLSGEDLRFAREWRPPDDLRPLAPEDLPDLVAQQFREASGRVGTPVYVTLDSHLSQSRGENLLRIADLLESVRLPDGSVAPNASRAAVFAEMIRAMSHDGPKATAVAFGVVVLVTLMVARRALPVIAVLGSLLVGVAWTVGIAAWFDVRLNFLNFVALPLTFGIGVEYAINLFERVRVCGGDVEAGITSAGGAVMLCSLTTILGYGSLLFADNRALNSFGAYAIAGEFSCIVTALLVMPAALSFAHHSRVRSHAPTVG